MRLHTCSHLRGLGSRKRAESRVGLVNPRNLLLELKIPSKSFKIVGPSNRTHEAVGHFLSKPKRRLEGEGNWLCCIIEVAECKSENPEMLVLMVALLGALLTLKRRVFSSSVPGPKSLDSRTWETKFSTLLARTQMSFISMRG